MPFRAPHPTITPAALAAPDATPVLGRGGRRLLLAAGLCLLVALTFADADRPRGLPFIRTYPLDEIGHVPRSLRLGFDEFGRVAVMYDGVYSVLNDTTWVDRIDRRAASRVRMASIAFARGSYYYGGRGSWGLVEKTPDGLFQAAPLVPTDNPAWTRVTSFNRLLVTGAGVYFYELNGVVGWDFARRRNHFFPMPRLVTAFAVGDRVFASCADNQLRGLLPATDEMRIREVPGLDGRSVVQAASLDSGRALLGLSDGRLVVFDGETVRPWSALADRQIRGSITAVERLVDGGVAVAVADQGVYLFSADDKLQWPLLVPEFRHVSVMAAGEPGVLWVLGENAVHRIFYHSPLTSFGQQHGLNLVWPEVVGWDGQVMICSDGQLYRSNPEQPGLPPAIQGFATQPVRRADHIAASGAHLLAGNASEVFSVAPDGTTRPITMIENVAGLEFISPDTCLVIGSREIAALRFAEGRWSECAARIPGVGDAPIRLLKQRALWIEMGGDRVARLTLRDGRLSLQPISLPWNETQWTNIGAIGDTIVLSGATGRRAYYDDVREIFCPAPQLEALLGRSPYWISRIKQAEDGVLWAAHPLGVVTFTPRGQDYEMDATTFELRNDSYPAVTLLPGNQIWIGAGRSLYHVEHPAPPVPERARTVLVSLVAGEQNLELIDQVGRAATPAQFSFDDNSLGFRFFSGTYAWRTPPLYEYRLGATEAWTPMDRNLVLRFPKLRDGAYRLEVRQSQPHRASAAPFAFAFVINPPWYRTPASYIAYGLGLLLTLLGLARWINLRSLRHNAELQHLVHERTKELEFAMDQLGEKSRNEATLAERSRLAGEIHDSMQQGLSGSILHLDTTMNHPSLTAEMRTKLNVVRNMLAYSREEVQQAVWNLESPLLQSSTLGDALRKIAGYISSGTTAIDVTAPAEPSALAPATRHHLLRIAQEAITNAVKHAGANRILVTLETSIDTVTLAVADDGRGFEPESAARDERHFGLRGLRSRARSIKADLQITSAPGAGTTVLVTVPASPPPAP
jgi:signal transduction histidine kinase